MTLRLKYFLILFLPFFSCDKADKDFSIKQIYYRPFEKMGPKSIKGTDTTFYKTEVLIILSDTHGVQWKDHRDVSEIKTIVSDAVKKLKDTPNLDFLRTGALALEKVTYDKNNFVVRLISPVNMSSQFLYKAYYDPYVKRLFMRHFLVECGDTNFLTQTNEDKIGLYTFNSLQDHELLGGLEYPKDVNNKKRNILTQKLGRLPTLKYETALAQTVTYMMAKYNNTDDLKKQMKDNNFVVGYFNKSSIGDGEYYHLISVYNDTISFKLSLTGSNPINYKSKRRLQKNELQEILKVYNDCGVSSRTNDSLPIPTNNYVAHLNIVFGKKNNKIFIGGFLDPVVTPFCLPGYPTFRDLKSDFRRYTSTLTGNYEFLYDNLASKFIALDSLRTIAGFQ